MTCTKKEPAPQDQEPIQIIVLNAENALKRFKAEVQSSEGPTSGGLLQPSLTQALLAAYSFTYKSIGHKVQVLMETG